MAYDEGLAERIRGILQDRADVVEKRMFGGLAFMVRGHMAVGILKDDLMVRVERADHPVLLREPHARTMDFTGRPMKSLLFVGADGTEDDRALERWVSHGLAFAEARPVKIAAPRRRRPID